MGAQTLVLMNIFSKLHYFLYWILFQFSFGTFCYKEVVSSVHTYTVWTCKSQLFMNWRNCPFWSRMWIQPLALIRLWLSVQTPMVWNGSFVGEGGTVFLNRSLPAWFTTITAQTVSLTTQTPRFLKFKEILSANSTFSVKKGATDLFRIFLISSFLSFIILSISLCHFLPFCR